MEPSATKMVLPPPPPPPPTSPPLREHMFDKVVTPSDVGKLNRLVIPKQFAEKFFPLDRSSATKGLLLSFEEDNGKQWHFRYSYWASSQSYVLTKGWSRFVKDKRLSCGDTVSFSRSRGRLLIGCKRREMSRGLSMMSFPVVQLVAPTVYHSVVQPYLHLGSMKRGGEVVGSPVGVGEVVAKRVRLFGVNLEVVEEKGLSSRIEQQFMRVYSA